MVERTKYSRKIDQMGRIVIPSKLRDKYGLTIGNEYTFCVFEEGNHRYVCLDCGERSSTPDDLDKATKLLEANGFKIVKSDD